MYANNKGHPNLTPLCLMEYPLVSDIANLQNCFLFYYENAPLSQDAFFI